MDRPTQARRHDFPDTDPMENHRARPALAASVVSLLATLCVLALGSALHATGAAAQGPPPPPPLRVFLDCPSGGCDRDFLITDLPFALWTQDRLDADVHLLVTRIGTPAGGSEFTMGFIGQRRFAGRVDTLVTFVPPNTSDDTRRREIARVAKIGLLRYAARLPGQERFSVVYAAPLTSAPAVGTAGADDPWNLWVYRARVNANGSAESRESDYELGASLSASRTAEVWKLDFSVQNEYRANRYELSDSTERRFIRRSFDASFRAVRSLSRHWSVGTRVASEQSDFRNLDASGELDLSAEYNYFPWAEATSRQLIALVAVGARYNDYEEVTIRDLTTELRPIARAIIAGESRQAWGTVDASLRYARYLHDSETYSISFNGRTSLRLSRGLSLDLRGEAAKVNDQLYLPRGDATDEEVLTRQRSLATAFRLNGSIGLSFTFGSIFNSIVNPRLDELR